MGEEKPERDDEDSPETTAPCCDLSELGREGGGRKAIVIAAGADCDCEDIRGTIMKHLDAALKDRDNVVMTRLNNEALSKIDALVDIDLFKSRSEGAAFFIAEGMRSRQDLFDKVMPTMEQIRRLKEELKQTIG